MFKCFKRCYIKAGFQTNNNLLIRSIMCPMIPNENLFTNYFKRTSVRLKKYSPDKATKID